MRLKHRDYSYLKYLDDHPEAEALEPDGVETVRKQSVDLDNQSIVTMSDMAAVYGSVLPTSEQASGQTEGGQLLPQKPVEPTATIGDDNLGSGSEPMDSTYPYPTNPNLDLRQSEEVITPKLQSTGDPAQIYGIQQLDEVHNTMSNTGNFGAVADNQLKTIVDRVEAAILAQVAASKDPMRLEEEDGNESLNPDGTLRANGQSGFDARTQIPQINQSTSIPGMNRASRSDDKWDGNVNDYREGGVPILANSLAQKNMLTQLLGAYGYVTNDLSEGLPQMRFEQKLGFSIATVKGSYDGQRLEVTITDKIGRPDLITSQWDKLQSYLQQKFPVDETQ